MPKEETVKTKVADNCSMTEQMYKQVLLMHR